MARPLRIPLAGGTYHVFARGNAKQRIFLDEPDHEAFLTVVVEALSRFSWACLAYCLMPNHYHLVVRTSESDLSEGMRHINGVYAQRFNRRHDRVGHVFQGRYGSTLIQADEHLVGAIRYVVLNPVRAGLVKRAEGWRWSSHSELLGLTGRRVVATAELLTLFGPNTDAAMQRYLECTATARGKERLGSGPVLGDEEFVAKYLPDTWTSRNVSAAARNGKRLPLTDLAECEDVDRAIATAYRIHGYTLCEIAAALGCHHTTVSRRLRRFEEQTRVEGDLRAADC
jgi:REP element-mobilizing transposase RayT